MTIRGTSWAIVTALLVSACTGDATREATTLSVDTLSDGTVRDYICCPTTRRPPVT